MRFELVDRLRDDLHTANYRAEPVMALLGASADAARQRGVFAPARRALSACAPGALVSLVRCFLLGEQVSVADLDTALPTLGASGAIELGLVAPAEVVEGIDVLRAALSLNPIQMVDARVSQPLDWWIISDLDDQLRRAPARPDHVMGVGGATRSLVAQAPTADAARCLDLGTGCGIVALHLALRGSVIATDVSERALTMARANARLNGVDSAIEFRRGDLFAPVAGETFDLILSNPPFVITPRGGDTPIYEYRDGGLAGDALIERVIREAPSYLAEDATLLCLANWESPWGTNGLDRVRGWIEAAAAPSASPLDAWVIERDRVSPEQYAETWARDGGVRPGDTAFETLLTGWLEDFAARRITAIGLGAIRLRRRAMTADTAANVIELDQATGPYTDDSLGSWLAAAFDAGTAAAHMSSEEVLAAHWLRSDAVTEERAHVPGQEVPSAITLSTDRPIVRRVAADPLLAAAVGACDGDLTLGQIADALATILEVDEAAATEALVAGARELAWLGMLSPRPR